MPRTKAQVHFEVEPELREEFFRAFPEFGARTAFLREAMIRGIAGKLEERKAKRTKLRKKRVRLEEVVKEGELDGQSS